ncbi:hypothetical protein C0989_005751 [Termitomyces sp. Mn162]|nr:hypothetical protein C0989_005751 [Termitomyces sp. Mn162]KAH0582346.1 hypothetical protein H2248_010295 [Termitomyces sp. 'cryptogamus']
MSPPEFKSAFEGIDLRLDLASRQKLWCSTSADKWRSDFDALRTALVYPQFMDYDVFFGHHLHSERFWVENQPYILARGYQLRPRYRAEWVPSWKNHEGPIQSLRMFEDAIVASGSHGHILDAVRISDGVKVVLKRLDTRSEELRVAHYLLSPQLAKDPRNHTVPILDVIPLPNSHSEALLVMPQLLHFAEIPFVRFGEVVEAVQQFLQGLDFMHENRIAHRDACYMNLMMDPSKVVPRGFHQMKPWSHDGVNTQFESFERWSVSPVQYYFIDFGLSGYYPKGVEYETATGLCGQDRTVPELLVDKPYDAFKLDIYQLGNVIVEIIKKYTGLELLLPLARAMTSTNPNDRPSPTQALKMLEPFGFEILQGAVSRKDIMTWEEESA